MSSYMQSVLIGLVAGAIGYLMVTFWFHPVLRASKPVCKKRCKEDRGLSSTPKVMDRQNELTSHLFRLVHLARSVEMKRALTRVDPEPHLNFWRLIHGNQLDIAVLEWCKVFGSDGEATHWKTIVPPANHHQFRDALFTAAGVTVEEWAAYWKEMKAYRDNLIAHHIEMNRVPNYPMLDIALKSSYFYYSYVIKELRLLGEMRFPDDLQVYCEAFEIQVREIAATAIASTAAIEERAY